MSRKTASRRSEHLARKQREVREAINRIQWRLDLGDFRDPEASVIRARNTLAILRAQLEQLQASEAQL